MMSQNITETGFRVGDLVRHRASGQIGVVTKRVNLGEQLYEVSLTMEHRLNVPEAALEHEKGKKNRRS